MARPNLRLTLRRSAARVRLLHHVVTDLGLPTMGLVVSNSVRRSAEQRRRPDAEPGPELTPGPPLEAHPEPWGAVFTFMHAALEVRFVAPDVARLSWGPGPAPIAYGIADESPFVAPEVTVRSLDDREDGTASSWSLSTDALEVVVRRDGGLSMSTPAGVVLRREHAPLRRHRSWELRYEMRPGERFSGLGEQAGGIDLRGGTYRTWNTDAGGAWGPGADALYLGIPVVLSTHRDGDLMVFYENSFRGTFCFGRPGDDRHRPGIASATFAGGMLRYYVIVGPAPTLMDRYSQLTGRPALPPRWALGYHQSRWGYRSEADVRDVVNGFAGRGLPLSALHLDIDYMDGYRVFTVDRQRFPDMAALTTDVAERGTRVVTIIDPGVKVDAGYALYREGVDAGHFCVDERGDLVEGVVWPGRSVFPDFSDPATRSWWAGQYQVLTDAGVAGAWHDMNEPASIALTGDPTLPSSTRHVAEGRGAEHAEIHNVYGLLMDRAGFDGLRAARPDRRPFIVSRSGWAGVQRWAWCWTGDVKTSWEGMRQQVATVIGMGLSGQPYCGPDIGGFSGVPDGELYVRWLQMSVFLPFCRTHSVVGAPRREPWCFPDVVEGVISGWIRMRYRLLPYLYTLAHDAASTGMPLVRPAWWPEDGAGDGDGDSDGADDIGPNAGDNDDVFMLGHALLLAPVTVPRSTSRPVTLPAGSWSSWWAGDVGAGEGGATVKIEAPFERTPVLVRAGSIIPMDDSWTDRAGKLRLDGDETGDDASVSARRPMPASTLSLDHAPGLLAFHCWPTAQGDARGTCVDDAGDGDGPIRRDELVLRDARPGASATLRWARLGGFPAPPRVRVVMHGVRAEAAFADGTPVDLDDGHACVVAPFTELRFVGVHALPS